MITADFLHDWIQCGAGNEWDDAFILLLKKRLQPTDFLKLF